MKNWGKDVTIITVVDANFLPGAIGLFNSLLLNKFLGEFRIVQSKEISKELLPRHPQLSVDVLKGLDGNYHSNVHRFNYFKSLEKGKYLFLDADVIVERPLGIFVDCLETDLLLSAEAEPKYNSTDVLFKRQVRQTGYSTADDIREIGYINGGLIGFHLPLHQIFIDDLVQKCKDCLSNITKYTDDPEWYFIDQDMLNVVARCCQLPLSVISPRQIEIGSSSLDWLQKRVFPFEDQQLLHKDQAKYIIHGAALRRPWLNPYPSTPTGKIRSWLYEKGVNGLFTFPTPYERAWAYYTCREDLPIPVSFWAKSHGFTAYKNLLWKKIHGTL